MEELGGDFRQVLPVVIGGSRAQIINASFKKSNLWRITKQFTLIENMRVAAGENLHNPFFMDIGESRDPDISPIPECFNRDIENNLESLINFVHPQNQYSPESVILTTNRRVAEINNFVIPF